MENMLARIAQKLFGISLIAFGIIQCIDGHLIAGRPPAWSSALPGELLMVYLVSGMLIFNGCLILINKKIKWLIPTAAFILIYCAFQNLYIVLWKSDIGASLTNFGKGITLASGLLYIVATSADYNRMRVSKFIDRLFIQCCYYCFGLFLLISGIQHFIYADFVKFLIPSWIPFPFFWVYLSGTALAIVGLSLITGIKRQTLSQYGAFMIFAWVISLHIPRALQELNTNEWIAVFEATAFSSLLFMISKISFVPFQDAVDTVHVYSKTK